MTVRCNRIDLILTCFFRVTRFSDNNFSLIRRSTTYLNTSTLAIVSLLLLLLLMLFSATLMMMMVMKVMLLLMLALQLVRFLLGHIVLPRPSFSDSRRTFLATTLPMERSTRYAERSESQNNVPARIRALSLA